ncbi:MAG: hypothetical protein K2M48_03295 [Clostridiales bacterium]|nr:hypothetical protein [Clostridiales bacterium]
MRHELNAALTVKAVTAALIGIAFIVFVGISYMGEFYHFYQMTFLSNFLTGVLMLIAAAVILLSGRDLPHFLYLDATVLLLMVVCVCSIFAPATTFKPSSLALHLIDPLIMLTFYMIFCDARRSPASVGLSALVFPTAYYIFMIIYGYYNHTCVYGCFDTTVMGSWKLLLYGFAAVGVIILMVYAVMYLNKLLHSFFDRRRAVRAERSRADG